MFHSSKKLTQDRNKNTGKFLDPKRESHARLRCLKAVLGRCIEYVSSGSLGEIREEIASSYVEVKNFALHLATDLAC